MSNKNGPSITRTNLIGRTIFVTSKKHCPTNQRPQTKFFTSEKNSIGFPAFQEGFPSQWWMNKTRSFVVPFKSWLLDKAVQALQIFLHGRNSSKAKKTKTHTPKQSSTECRFAWMVDLNSTHLVCSHIYHHCVAICGRCYSWWSIQHFYQQPFFNRQPWQFQKLRRAFSKEVNRLKALERPLRAIV